MALTISKVLLPIILVVLVAGVGATPPGIAKNPSHASCKIKKYKHCYNLVHVCPKFCPDACTVECASCKPICVGDSNPPPVEYPTPSTPEYPPLTPSTPRTPEYPPPTSSTPSTPKNPPPSPSPPTTPSTPKNPPPTPSTPHTPKNPPPTPSTPSKPENPPPTTPSTPENPPPTPHTPENPPPTSSTPSTPKNPPPSIPSTPSNPSPSSPPPSTPTTPSPTPSSRATPPSTPTPSPPKTARCRNKEYPRCYNMEHVCPNTCPGGCDVDCNTCKPVCKCDRPGAVCQDPRFIGGDGITFYFHGKKDSNFCLLSDPNLHINAHFIGRRNHNMKRDFTWVQSIAILFDDHQLFIGARKTATWDDSTDRLALSFDGEPLALAESQGSTWKSSAVSVTRADAGTNSVVVEVEGRFRVTAKVVPITEEDSRVHNYGITSEDCFAHLDLGFKFLSLSDNVSGVLGQTYGPSYVSRVDVGAKMAVMGGERDFEASSLFSSDCSVSRFVSNNGNGDVGAAITEGFEVPGMSCASRIDGQGVVCRR